MNDGETAALSLFRIQCTYQFFYRLLKFGFVLPLSKVSDHRTFHLGLYPVFPVQNAVVYFDGNNQSEFITSLCLFATFEFFQITFQLIQALGFF